MEDSQYRRCYPLFSACGLNCSLCPRHHTDGDSRCPGCGGEDFLSVHPLCGVLSCCLRHGLEYCCQCESYPCEKYKGADLKDSFISHLNQFKDFQKAREKGMDFVQTELEEKTGLLENLLENYNDGRHKSFYCLAVNLLELNDLREIMGRIGHEIELWSLAEKEKTKTVVDLFEKLAKQRNISLKLRK